MRIDKDKDKIEKAIKMRKRGFSINYISSQIKIGRGRLKKIFEEKELIGKKISWRFENEKHKKI